MWTVAVITARRVSGTIRNGSTCSSRNAVLPLVTKVMSSSRSSTIRNSSCISSSPLLQQQQQQHNDNSACIISRCRASSLPSYRHYSSTSYNLDKKKGDADAETDKQQPKPKSRFQTINNTGLTDDEIEKLFEEEERKAMEKEQRKFLPNWKPGMRKRPLEFSNTLEEFLYEMEPEKYKDRWTHLDKRCGALAIKVGMMPVFDTAKWGIRYPCTVLYLDRNVVVGHKTLEKHGYSAVQIAAGERKRKNVSNSVLGQFKKLLKPSTLYRDLKLEPDETEESLNIWDNPPYLMREFRVSDDAYLPPVFSEIHARHFVPGQYVDVAGITKGKGFQGGMKRHHFSGGTATHGNSKSHRTIGSTGSCQDPGKVWKGKKMPGQMGNDRVTIQNLRVIQVDRGRDLIYVLGAVPGQNGNFVEIRDAVKKAGKIWGKKEVVLDAVPRPPVPTFQYDAAVDGKGVAGHEIFMPLPEMDPLNPESDDAAA